MSKRILSPEQKEKNRIRARKYYNEHKEKCNTYEKQRRLKIKNDPILNQQMQDYKREWFRNKRKKDKENAELVIKYKIVLDKIKEILKSNINFYEENFKLSNMTAEEFKKEHPYILGSYDDSKNLLERINELLEEII